MTMGKTFFKPEKNLGSVCWTAIYAKIKGFDLFYMINRSKSLILLIGEKRIRIVDLAQSISFKNVVGSSVFK